MEDQQLTINQELVSDIWENPKGALGNYYLVKWLHRMCVVEEYSVSFGSVDIMFLRGGHSRNARAESKIFLKVRVINYDGSTEQTTLEPHDLDYFTPEWITIN